MRLQVKNIYFRQQTKNRLRDLTKQTSCIFFSKGKEEEKKKAKEICNSQWLKKADKKPNGTKG